jgi:L-iditol 2-dehydrogenase
MERWHPVQKAMMYLACNEQDVVGLTNGDEPQPGPGEITVRLKLCGVCGTDVLKVFGKYPKPQKLGHEVVGVVHKLGAGVTQYSSGQRVGLAHHVPDYTSYLSRHGSETMDAQFKFSNIDPGGFSEIIRVPATNLGETVVPIPDHVSDRRAVFMEPMACCIRAIDRMNLQRGNSVLVVGIGAVGILFVPMLRDRGVATLVTDIRSERIETAMRWGAAAGASDGMPEICKRHTEGRGVDHVILTVVNEATVALALTCLRDGGTLMIFGGKPGGELKIPIWDLWLREINVLTSYSATPSGLKRAMAELSQPQYENIEELISHTVPFAEAQTGFELVHHGKASKVVVVPGV